MCFLVWADSIRLMTSLGMWLLMRSSIRSIMGKALAVAMTALRRSLRCFLRSFLSCFFSALASFFASSEELGGALSAPTVKAGMASAFLLEDGRFGRMERVLLVAGFMASEQRWFWRCWSA